MQRVCYVLLILLCSFHSYAKVYQCMDALGERIFSDKPCHFMDSIGKGEVSVYDEAKRNSIELKKVPTVVDEQAADKIRYSMTPMQAKAKYCAKYTQVERDRLIALKQVVLGMFLADVIKVWGAPLASNGNQIIFQDGDDEVMISLIAGCVINIERNFWEEDYLDDFLIETD